MKKILIYIFAILLGASIPIYFLLIWEPLKSEEALSENIINISTEDKLNENTNLLAEEEKLILKQKDNQESLFNYLEGNRRESLNLILKKLSILDIVKVNEYFSDKNNEEKIKQGIELVKRRLSSSDYDIFKSIIQNKVNSTFL
ncbi:hypothetical protein [Clostridium nigeriense]|uniref:hypothetical protein n=1 Tax=Clostridium nigeriense TaxID=1805470 RepID=UPI00082ACAD4|nr:hypothetical protein [Clostridium nigeriense]